MFAYVCWCISLVASKDLKRPASVLSSKLKGSKKGKGPVQPRNIESNPSHFPTNVRAKRQRACRARSQERPGKVVARSLAFLMATCNARPTLYSIALCEIVYVS